MMNFEHILIIIWYYYIRVMKTIIIIVMRVIINFEHNIYVKEFLWRIFSNKIPFPLRQKSIMKSIMKAFIMTIECSNLSGCLSDKFVIQNSRVLHFDSIFNPAMRYIQYDEFPISRGTFGKTKFSAYIQSQMIFFR